MNSRENDEIEYLYSAIFFLAALAIIFWQVYAYLRFSIWNEVSLITALMWIDSNWATYPTDWIGLHNLLQKIPLSGLSFLIGFLVSLAND
jgi:hypothetical protein